MEMDELVSLRRRIDAAKRTVLVHPAHEAAVQEVIDQSNVGGLYTVLARGHVPKDRIFVIDPHTVNSWPGLKT